MSVTPVNDLSPELLGIHSLNFAAHTNSASRNVMMGGHNSQRIIIENPDPNRCPTGPELELGKYTFDVKIPRNSRILKILKRYPVGVDQDSLEFNPETLVIYEEEDTRLIDFVSISHHQSFHQTFGFRNKLTPEASNIRQNTPIKGGTILAHSPGLGPNGFYMYGKMMETVFMSVPGSAEDGFVVSESACEDLAYYAYETRRCNVGSRQFAMNTMGDAKNYQAYPHIGQLIRPDGQLLCLRDYDVDISPVEMSIYDTMEPDMYFDEFLYTKAGVGRVVDIKVIGSHNPTNRMPAMMSAQFQRYQRALVRYHREIVEFEQKLRQEKKRQTGIGELNLSRKFHQLVVDSMAIINHRLPGEQGKYNLNLSYRKEPLDEFMIEFVIEYRVVPGIGHKLTGLAGDKGVIVKVLPDDHMPRDAAGNVAKVISAPEATANRMNLSRQYSHFHGAAARDLTAELIADSGLPKGCSKEMVELMDPALFDKIYKKLMLYYYCVSPWQQEEFTNLPQNEKVQHIYDVFKDGIYPFMPINSPRQVKDAANLVRRNFKQVYGPISYIGNSGRRSVTRRAVRSGPMYYMLLDKTATEWSSTSTARLQIFGILTPLTKSEKFARPYRDSPTRTIGETEGRIYSCYGGRRMTAELFDRSNNPAVQKAISWKLLTEEQPGNIDQLVDREQHPYGNSRNRLNMLHILNTAGMTITFRSEDEDKK